MMQLKKWHVVGILLLLGGVLWVPDLILYESRIHYWREEGTDKLTAAKSPEEFQQAIGYLGAFIPLADGNWIAIHYRDAHSVLSPLPLRGVASIAIARDSGGQWFESREHFCGRFRFLNLWIRAQTDPSSVEQPVESLSSFGNMEEAQLFRATDLDSARTVLVQLGFHKTN